MTERPNIILILVDEMRYPVHFPAGISNPDQFMKKFMPNTYRLLWEPGVRLREYYTASSDCTPGRGTLVTGLYAQQTFCLATRANVNAPQGTTAPQPPLSPAFPTYGKVLRDAGYDTPYIGKWHLSDFPASPDSGAASSYMNDYGFQGLTIPDALGLPGQGYGSTPGAPPPVGSTPPPGDPSIANQAVTWLKARATYGDTRPFCLTVGFVNPHDKQFFWGGIDTSRYIEMYASRNLPAPMNYTFNVVRQMYPDACGYALPDNWQAAGAGGPKLHRVFREVTEAIVGGISDDPAATAFTFRDTPIEDYSGIAVAPFAYWTRALDMYTQAMSDVDVQVGQVVQNIPRSILANSVIVFTSDHGEYASAHGLQGKGMTAYQETMHLPFAFRDFTNRYVTQPGDRDQFLSSVDVLPLFARLGFGDDSWMQLDAYRGLYDTRNDMLAVVTDDAPVLRNYALYSADEVVSTGQNFLHAPQHVLGYVDGSGKLGMYSHWQEGEAKPLAQGQEIEYYDYSRGRSERDNEPAKGQDALRRMNDDLIANELQKPLPERYRAAQQAALAGYWKFVKLADAQSIAEAFTG